MTQPNFPYLRAGTKGSLVGVSRGSFGYVPPPSSLGSLPHKKTTVVVSSYLYLEPTIPSAESDIATAYLRALDTVDSAVAQPSVPAADWQTLAARSAADIADPSNWVTVNGHQYLRSYVSDTRSAPELLTQAGVLAGIRAYEARYSTSVPFDATLDADLVHVLRPGIRHRHEQPSPRSVGTGRELVLRQQPDLTVATRADWRRHSQERCCCNRWTQ